MGTFNFLYAPKYPIVQNIHISSLASLIDTLLIQLLWYGKLNYIF